MDPLDELRVSCSALARPPSSRRIISHPRSGLVLSGRSARRRSSRCSGSARSGRRAAVEAGEARVLSTTLRLPLLGLVPVPRLAAARGGNSSITRSVSSSRVIASPLGRDHRSHRHDSGAGLGGDKPMMEWVRGQRLGGGVLPRRRGAVSRWPSGLRLRSSGVELRRVQVCRYRDGVATDSLNLPCPRQQDGALGNLEGARGPLAAAFTSLALSSRHRGGGSATVSDLRREALGGSGHCASVVAFEWCPSRIARTRKESGTRTRRRENGERARQDSNL